MSRNRIKSSRFPWINKQLIFLSQRREWKRLSSVTLKTEVDFSLWFQLWADSIVKPRHTRGFNSSRIKKKINQKSNRGRIENYSLQLFSRFYLFNTVFSPFADQLSKQIVRRITNSNMEENIDSRTDPL